MQMNEPQAWAPGAAASPEVVNQIGQITRQLHDTLRQLGVMPSLQACTDGLPDARSRLAYIAEKTAAAADKVLSTVDAAKAETETLARRAEALAAELPADDYAPVTAGSVRGFVEQVRGTSDSLDGQLTEIMMAQDFHDLTGQVVQKVVKLANELEDSLVKLLVQVVPAEMREKIVDPGTLQGPVVAPEGRTDVVTNQGEVDDLLASLGF